MESSKHYYMIDNLRLIAILCVVFGHLCETIHFYGSEFLYLLIYFFHMPLFACISGFCFSYGKGEKYKVLKKLIYPYLIFQTLWSLFNINIMNDQSSLQYTTPIWIMWYLMSLSAWYFAAHLLEVNGACAKNVLTVSVLIALITGYDITIGYFLSLSRTIVLFPFFYLGICIRKNIPMLNKMRANMKYRILSVCVLFACTILIFIFRFEISSSWLYHSLDYIRSDSNIVYRSIILLTATVIILSLFCIAPERNLGFLTRLGQNTMPVFLLHGFVVKVMDLINWGSYVQAKFLWCIIISLLMVFVFGSKPAAALLRPLVRWPFSKPYKPIK